MNLKQIKLEKIMDREYRELAEKWRVSPRKAKYQYFWGKITQSLACQDYGTLIESFIKTPGAYQIAVRGEGPNWEKRYVRTDQNPPFKEKEIYFLAELARKNPYKRAFFELKFLKQSGNDAKRLFILSFAEEDNQIFLSDLNMPKIYENFISVSLHLKKISYYYLNGMLDYKPNLVEVR